MSKLQEIFNRIEETKKEQREIKSMYRDALIASDRHKNVIEELKGLREKKKKIEEEIKNEFKSEFDKLEVLKADLDNDRELLSDAAISQVARGEKIEIIDKNSVKYEPIFSVKFKKVG